jgi:hypothetical protein
LFNLKIIIIKKINKKKKKKKKKKKVDGAHVVGQAHVATNGPHVGFSTVG